MADAGATDGASRIWLGVFTAVVAIVVAPLAIFTGALGFFIACFDDNYSDFCNANDPDSLYILIYGAPVLAMLVVGTLATVRRSWKLAALGAGLSVLLLVAWFVIAIAIGQSNSTY